jgi:hypothetical protein
MDMMRGGYRRNDKNRLACKEHSIEKGLVYTAISYRRAAASYSSQAVFRGGISCGWLYGVF